MNERGNIKTLIRFLKLRINSNKQLGIWFKSNNNNNNFAIFFGYNLMPNNFKNKIYKRWR